MIYVKILFRDKRVEAIHLPIEKWGAILNDSKSLVAYTLNEEEWQGRVLNKADVISAEPDYEYTEKIEEPKWVCFLNKETGKVEKLIEGQIPDDLSKYERL